MQKTDRRRKRRNKPGEDKTIKTISEHKGEVSVEILE